MPTKMRVMLIDNYDSFVHNLADEFSQQGCQVDTYRANLPIQKALSYIQQKKPRLLVFSPGPGKPSEASLCLNLLRHAPVSLAILGVCLGHQCIIEYFGGTVSRATPGFHGKSSVIQHDNSALFSGIANPMSVGRYHSLIGTDIPDDLIISASISDIVMAIRHRTRPIFGVQFHPESILTPDGSQLIQNLLTQIEVPYAHGSC